MGMEKRRVREEGIMEKRKRRKNNWEGKEEAGK